MSAFTLAAALSVVMTLAAADSSGAVREAHGKAALAMVLVAVSIFAERRRS